MILINTLARIIGTTVIMGFTALGGYVSAKWFADTYLPETEEQETDSEEETTTEKE